MSRSLARGLDRVVLDQVEQDREHDKCAHGCEGATVEDAAVTEAVMHFKRLLRSARIGRAAQTFYLYYRTIDHEEQLSFAYVSRKIYYMLNVTRLRMLREVASRGTIAAAAESLFMTPSAVSQQMAVLEREAGTPLLERWGRGVRPTEAGLKLVANTERILAELERAEADLAAATRGVVGRVRVSAFPTAARALLVPALPQLIAEFPNLHLSMIDLEPEESLPALKADELDVVVTYEWNVLPRLEDAGVEREELICEPVYLALPATHVLATRGAVSVADLRDEEWIVGRDSTSMLDLVVAATRREGYEPRTDFHSMDFQVILAAVGAGLGVALVPPLALIGEYPDVVIKRIEGLRLDRTIWATIRRGSSGNPGIAAVLAALREAAARVALHIPASDEEPPDVT
jgi:DNA-binding transcriptional LysR family regulator